MISSTAAQSRLIELRAGEPVTVVHPDGGYDVYTYNLVQTRAADERVSVTRSINKGAWSAEMELWADGRWSDRTVRITKIGKNFTGSCVRYENAEETITRATGTGNVKATARATGDIVWYLVSTGSPAGTVSYDFEIQLDPADSSRAYLKVNDSI